jgi:hypothetical protein
MCYAGCPLLAGAVEKGVLWACLSRDSVAVGSIAMGSGDDGSVRYKDFKGPFSARGRVRDGHVGCQVREPSVQDRGFFRAIHRSEAPGSEAFWPLRRVQGKGGRGLREWNPVGGGRGLGSEGHLESVE